MYQEKLWPVSNDLPFKRPHMSWPYLHQIKTFLLELQLASTSHFIGIFKICSFAYIFSSGYVCLAWKYDFSFRYLLILELITLFCKHAVSVIWFTTLFSLLQLIVIVIFHIFFKICNSVTRIRFHLNPAFQALKFHTLWFCVSLCVYSGIISQTLRLIPSFSKQNVLWTASCTSTGDVISLITQSLNMAD